MRRRHARLVLTLAASLLGAACSMAPRYVRPAAPVPPSWPAGDAYLRRAEAALPSVSYREIFTDPKLLAILDRALANNQDVRVALANVEAARANYRIQRAQLFPQVDVGGTVTRGQRSTANQANSFAGGGYTSYATDFGLNAFELDLFGRLRSLRDAQLQEFLGTEAAVRATRLALLGELANAYLTLATDRSLLHIAEDTEASALRSVALTRARLAGGVAPRSDLRQAETVLAQAQADHANQTTLVAQDRNAIELLVGAPVEDALLPAAIEAVDGQLRELPAGLDSRVLLRRPDVVQAEYALRGANARIGSARAAFFPTISLTGAAGLASGTLSSLFTGDAFTWSVTPGFSLPIFDGGTRRGNLALTVAQRDLTLARYRQSIQTAFREVSDALARRGTIDRQLAAQRLLATAARDTFVLADARYREGIDTFLVSLDAQRTLYTARRSLANARLLRASNLVELYRTLGGDQLIDTLPAPRSTGAPAPEVALPRP